MHRKTVIDFRALGERYTFTQPIKELKTRSLAEVTDLLAQVESYQEQGYYVVGYVSYEAAPAFEETLAVHSGPLLGEYLLYFTIHDSVEKSSIPLTYEEVDLPSNWQEVTSAEEYEKAIAHADAVLGADATGMLRDWEQWRKLGANDQVQPNDYIKSNKNTNLLLLTGMSMWGYVSRPVGIGSKYAHGKLLSSSETLESRGPWGEGGTVLNYMVTSGSNVSKVALGKIPLKLDQYDPQAKTGVPYAEFSAFNADETLLVRAEAKAMLGRYDAAVADLNTLLKVFIRSEAKSTEATRTLTLSGIQSFYNALRYYTPSQPTVKKQLHTDFTIEATTQEPLLQCILHLRRLVTLHEGLRMQDVKRYGMTIYRRRVSVENRVIEVTDSMKVNDPRQAIQLPQDVITAGLQANPR